MIIILVISIILNVIAFVFLLGMHKYILTLIDKMASPELYPCKLVMLINYNQVEDNLIMDFQYYKTQGIIVAINNFIESPRTEKERLINGKILCFKNAVVYEFEGVYLWKLSSQ